MKSPIIEQDYRRIRFFLENSLNEFESCGRRALEIILSVPTMAIKRFGVSPVIESRLSTACIIRSINPEFAILVYLGFNSQDLAALVPGESETAMQLDAIGEVTNVISGNFLSQPRFFSHFGRITPGLPEFVQRGGVGRKSWCIHGVLRVNSVKVYLGLMVERADRMDFTVSETGATASRP